MPLNSAPRPLLIDLARRFGGAEVRVLQLAEAFGPGGCQVACLQGSPLAARLREVGFAPLEFAGKKSDPRLAAFLSQAASRGSYDVIDAHNVQSHFWGALARKHGFASVATVHSSTRMEHPGKLKGQLYELLERLTLARFDQVITVSHFLCGELRGFGIPSERIHRVPNGIAASLPTPTERAAFRQTVRAELGIPSGAPLIGTAGRLEPAKGYDLLLQAVDRLRAGYPDLRCVIAGSGSLEQELKTAAQALGLDGRVIFTGFRTDIPRLLLAMDIFALPSRTEGIPYALLEASAAGLPVVASRVGGVPEIICDGQAGLLVAPEQVEALAAALDRLLREPELAAQMGRRAAADTAAQFTLEAMVAGTCRAYEAAAARRKASRQ